MKGRKMSVKKKDIIISLPANFYVQQHLSWENTLFIMEHGIPDHIPQPQHVRYIERCIKGKKEANGKVKEESTNKYSFKKS
jgi:hypothetical protein